MKRPEIAKYLTPLLALSPWLAPSDAQASIGELLQKQQAAQIDTIIYIGAGAVAAVFVLMLLQTLLKSRQITKLTKERLANQSELDTMPMGLLHVNLEGKVVYANKTASKLLGRLNEKIINQALTSCFQSNDTKEIEQALSQNNISIAVKARASNLFLSLNIGQTSEGHKKPYKAVCLANESEVRRNLAYASKELSKQNKMANALALGNFWINTTDNTFEFDARFAELLSLEYEQGLSFPLQTLTERIHQGDSSAWAKAIQNVKNTGSAEACCRMQVNVEGKEKCFIALRIGIVATVDRDSECTSIHCGVLDNSQADKDKQSFELKTQEQQAIFNASHHPIYAVDVDGNIAWSNSAFNMLFRHQLPSARTKNLYELDFFPEDLKKLHQSCVGLSGRSYEAQFSLPSPQGNDDDSKHFNLALSFASAKNRLSDTSHKLIVGILTDVSELEAAKATVQQHQAQLNSMLNLAPFAIATIDGEDRIISANSVMSRRLGFSESELKARDFYQLFDEPTAAGKAAKKLHQTGHLRDYHAQLKGKDNKLHPSELHVDIINKEKQEYLCWIADRSDEQFQQDKFDSLLEHSSMPMAILGENGFSRLNAEACKFFCVENDFDLFGVAPYSTRLNTDEDTASALRQIVDEVKVSGKAKVFTWEHQVGDLILPCQVTYVPLYKEQNFDSILCIWMDKRELQKADEARQLAINLQQAAMREIEEKQQLLASSQDQLATKMRTLADTEHKLQTVQEDLNETQSEYHHLQQAHKNVTDNLLELKSQYGLSRQMLADAQKANADLNAQLENSSQVVEGLNEQRNEIAEALKRSEQNYRAAQEQLSISEENTKALHAQQDAQQAKMHALVTQISDMKQAVNDKDTQIGKVSEQINILQSQLNSSSNTTERLREQLVNQRQASEKAELERREIEQTCQLAQAELRNKVRHLSHLESEMEKLEEMSNQEKGDMQAQQSALKQELDEKLQQLQHTQSALKAAHEAAEHEKKEKAAQQALLAKVQKELLEVEQTAHQKQEELEQKEKEQRNAQKQLQQKLWSELQAKQQKLQETEQILKQAKQQTESEKIEKEKHRQLFEKLQNELLDIEKRNADQQAKMAQSDEQWHRSKELLKQEVEAKREQLAQTKQALDEIQQQADKERLARIEQEQKLEQLTIELSDVETRANKQKEMLAGSDEQWRKHHDEIEQQKQQLQQDLQAAQAQNESLQRKLSTKLNDLQAAESQVSVTQSGEQAVQQELDKVRAQADELQIKISHQEEKELALQQQLASQTQALENKETSISHLQDKQKALTQELLAVQQEYAQSKEAFSAQHNSHINLSTQMNELEGALTQSKQQLADKESALQAAQQALQESEAKLAKQEDALLSAHKQELQQANEQAATTDTRKPEIESLPMPSKPNVWFDLLSYLQNQPNIESLPIALNELMDDLQATIASTESALESNDKRELLKSSKILVSLSQKINSDALSYLMSSIQNDCTNGMVDNVSIRWPATRQGLEKTLRVVYSHLHA